MLNEQVNHLSSTYLPKVSLCAEFKGHNSSLKVISKVISCNIIIRDCGSNLYVGMGVVEMF